MATVATTGGSNHGSREARRRRIVERGSDRLALITGRIQSLPSNPDQSRSPICPPGQTPADSAWHEDVVSGSSLPNHESGGEPCQHDNFDETIGLLPRNSDKGRTIASRAVSLLGVEKELSQISSSMRSSALDHPCERQSHRSTLTTGQIYSAIAASENIRMWCSVAAAIVVILSSIGFPILGRSFIRSIIIFRPLYLLLLTNISLVVAWLILGTQGAEVRTGHNSVPTFGGNALVDQLGKALESGLLLQKIFGALFMDVSIYAIVLVCGLCLVRRLGW